MRSFASDNNAGMTPEALEAFAAVQGHAVSYGDDALTQRAAAAVAALFDGLWCEVFFVFTGTAANALSLASLAPSFGIAACTPEAHVLVDECGAPGFFGGGLQLRALPSVDGRLAPEALDRWAALQDVHVGRPSVVSLTQSTELGTVYSLEELRVLRGIAAGHGLRVHLDGARLANALASLGCTPREAVEAAGADILVLGGTKNGLGASEAIVCFHPAAAAELPFRRKQAGQLASKHRVLSAPWLGALEGGAWLRRAAQANAMAARLAEGFVSRGFALAFPRQANAVFVSLGEPRATGLRALGYGPSTEESWHGAHRFVCAWDTEPADVEALLAAVDGLSPAQP